MAAPRTTGPIPFSDGQAQTRQTPPWIFWARAACPFASKGPKTSDHFRPTILEIPISRSMFADAETIVPSVTCAVQVIPGN